MPKTGKAGLGAPLRWYLPSECPHEIDKRAQLPRHLRAVRVVHVERLARRAWRSITVTSLPLANSAPANCLNTYASPLLCRAAVKAQRISLTVRRPWTSVRYAQGGRDVSATSAQ